MKVPPKPPSEITPRQRQIYRWYYERTAHQGRPPTFQETGNHFGLCRSCITCHFRYLRRLGYVSAPARGRLGGVRFLKTPDGDPFPGFSIPITRPIKPARSKSQ